MGQRRALLIANDRYIDESLSDLYAPREEARDLLSLLADADIGAFDQTVLLENESKSAIERAMESMLRAAGPEDLVLLYFSGHGVRSSKRGRLHLAVANTEVDHLSSTAVSASFVRELLDESDAASSVILLDCCYSGAFEGQGLKTTDDLALDGELKTGYGRYVVTATNSVERADDGRPASPTAPRLRSAFTETIIQGLSTGAADLTGQGRITPDDLWRYVRMELPRRAPSQSPCQFGQVSDEIHIALSREGHHRQRQRRDHRDLRLGDLLGPLEPTDDVKLCAVDWRRRGLLRVPVGQAHRIDQPAGEPLWLDLASSEGHLLVIGRAGTGKTTLLRTIVGGLALTHSDQEVTFDCLESGGNWLGPMRRLPHVRAVVGDDEVDEVGRLLDRLEQDVLARKQLFRRHELESPTSLRARRGTLDGGPYPDVFLLVDRWQDFAALLPDFTARVVELANKGLGYGIHVAVVERSWRAIPEELLELPQARVETRLSQPQESLVNPDLAARLPANLPGWAIHGRRTFRIALPDLAVSDADPEPDPAAGGPDGAGLMVSLIAQAWSGAEEPVEVDARRVPFQGRQDEALTVLGLADLDGLRDFTGHDEPLGPGFLRVPIGVDTDGEPVLLDLKESARDGVGPHGLLVGATGSGKSELLRTIVLGLAARHSPSRFNVVMIDFKGSSVFAPLGDLPHVSGHVSSLAEDLTLLDRLRDALAGELARRQELLRLAGGLSNWWAYEQARAAGGTPTELPALPTLLVVCDEFTDLFTVRPALAELFARIGRSGRALGVHLLLSTSRVEEDRLRGLDRNLSYRIVLRTFSGLESRMLIGVPDAYELPGPPGHGYLRTGPGDPVRFRAAYVSGPLGLRAGDADPPPELTGRSPLEIVVDRLRDGRPRARQVWLPPLDEPPSLDELLAPPEAVAPPGDEAPAQPVYARAGLLSVPIGVVDRPYEQRRDPLLVELAGAGGNVGVVGASLAGKSTLVATLIAALALTHTPREVQFYCLDFGGGTLGALAGLPHVSGVAGRRDTEAVRRTVAEVTRVLAQRADRFAAFGIASMEGYRRLRAAGEYSDDPSDDVFLVVDGWHTLLREHEELEEAVSDIAHRGSAHGVRLVLTAGRWVDIRPGLRAQLGTRLELRLTDPNESEIDRGSATNVPERSPGRGLTSDQAHFRSALPRVDGRHEATDLAEASAALAERVAAAWPGAPAPPVRLLPLRLTVTELDRAWPPGGSGLPIGLDESALDPVALDPAAEPHLVVFGDAECGKTNLLRLFARQIVAGYSPEEARLVIADYRRGLLGAVESGHLLDYAPSESYLAQTVAEVRTALRNRLPGPDVTPEQLRERSWWKGPEVYVLVDDYDLVAAGGNNPLGALRELLPQARDVGLHLVLARRSGGAGRALYEPVLQMLRDMGATGLLMSGDREEGPLWGGRRLRPMPPGRGVLVRRRHGAQLVQTALVEAEGGKPSTKG
ncbi:type VII secretion protein EccCb [Micromonospora sp. RTGN7]|uniref:type VII secretion protein EccCb n=1 Tax=Micromonospora sp. RTGN7 TaxID=3016526 RepID=UPI0029FECF2E|nr:type VII secretion protein EccCb [Micromonospora sp. RTGN7]